jgi:hypothetical protein
MNLMSLLKFNVLKPMIVIILFDGHIIENIVRGIYLKLVKFAILLHYYIL